MANQQKSWLTNLITAQISGSSTNLREIWMLPSLSTDNIILKEYIIIAEYSVELRYSSSRTITLALFIAEDVRCLFVQSTAVCWISAKCQVLSRCWGYAVDLYQSICTRCWNIELCSYQLLSNHCLQSLSPSTQVHCGESREDTWSHRGVPILSTLVLWSRPPCPSLSPVREAGIPARKMSHLVVLLWHPLVEISEAHGTPEAVTAGHRLDFPHNGRVTSEVDGTID